MKQQDVQLHNIARINFHIREITHIYIRQYGEKCIGKTAKKRKRERMGEKTRDVHVFVSVYACTNKLMRFTGGGANLHVFCSRCDKR